MADVFYRGFEPAHPVDSGTRHLVAAAGRLFWAAALGVAGAPGETGAKLRELLGADNLKVMAYVMAAWVIANVVGQPVAGAVDAILLGLGVLTLAERAVKLAGSLKDYAVTAYQANDEIQIAKAGGFFAAALSEIGVTTIELVVGHKTFKSLRQSLADRGLLGRITGKPMVEPVRPSKTESPRVEPPRVESPKGELGPAQGPPVRDRFGRVKRAAREVTEAIKDPRGPGVAHTKDFLPALALGLGALALVGGGVGVAVAVSRSRSRSRSRGD